MWSHRRYITGCVFADIATLADGLISTAVSTKGVVLQNRCEDHVEEHLITTFEAYLIAQSSIFFWI